MTVAQDVDTAAVPVEQVIDQVKAAITKANVGTDNEDLVVTSVDLDIKVVLSVAGGTEWEWKVPIIGLEVGGGTKKTHADTKTISLKLVPPPVEGRLDRREAREIEDDVVRAVETIRAGLARAAVGEPVFKLDEASFEVEFGVTAEGNLSLVAVAQGKHETTHTLKLSFGRRSDLEKAGRG